jgi:cyclin-dependent kinase 12/13
MSGDEIPGSGGCMKRVRPPRGDDGVGAGPAGGSPGGPLPDVAPARKRWRWSRDVSEFEEIEQIGEGTYGQVLKGRDRVSDEIVALKKVRMDQEKEGFPTTAIRELKMLRSLRHENVVRLKEIVTGQNAKKSNAMRNRHEIYMVFEYVDNDLTGLLDTPSVVFTEAHVKAYMKQLLQGLWYCHEREVLHRDIKGSNLLIDAHGCLKIADLGLARTYADNLRQYTNKVITLWYRSPELLLGAEDYGPEVDIWSVGCLLIEMLTRRTAFPGQDEADQLDKIYRVCGVPDDRDWPEWRKLPLARMVKEELYGGDRLRESLPGLSDLALDLVRSLLAANPRRRPTAHAALNHDWFWSRPYPTPREELPRYSATHEYTAKQRRKQEAAAGRRAEREL